MKLGERAFGGASATLRRSSALPMRMREHIVELRSLYTKPQDRGQGHASALLRTLSAEADADGQMLMLMPDDGLAGFYGRFGFDAIQDHPLIMARRVGGHG